MSEDGGVKPTKPGVIRPGNPPKGGEDDSGPTTVPETPRSRRRVPRSLRTPGSDYVRAPGLTEGEP